MATHQSVLTLTWTSSKVVTTWQTNSVAYKLKPRSFYKSTHLRVHSADFHPGVNCAWQYYQTPKSTVASEQFCLLNSLLQFHLHFNLTICTSKSKWLPLTITLQLQSHHLGHPSTWSHVSVTRWHIHQMRHDIQNGSIKEAIYLWGLLSVQSNLAGQFHLFLAQVLSLWTMILIGKMLPLLILLLT